MDIRQLSPNFSVVGQISPADLAQAKRLGFETVVCNRPDGEAPEQPSSLEMAAAAARAGIDFEYIPIVPGEMTQSDAEHFAHILRGAEGPVLGYCRTGARAEKLWERAMEIAAPPKT